MRKKDFFALSVVVIMLSACSSADTSTNSVDVVIPDTYTQNDGRMLGSVGCTQCHGTNGNSVTSWDSITGEGEFLSENFSNHPIMQTIADGYTTTEKSVIDSWLNSMPENEND